MKYYNFWEIAEYKQRSSKTITEASAEMRMTCGKCRKAGFCNEDKCKINQIHKLRLLELSIPGNTVHFVEVHTRAYTTSPEAEKRKKIQTILTQFYNKHSNKWEHITKMRFDDAQILIENEDYRGCLIILRSLYFYNLAHRIENILKEVG